MRWKRKVVVLSIQILIVALALALTGITYAWYTSNTRVETSTTTIISAAGANTHIDVESNPDYDTYMGQKGTNDDTEAVYYVTKNLTVTFTPLAENSAVQLRYTSVAIEKTKNAGTVSSETDDDVIPSFTWRLTYGGHTYQPDENGFAYYESGNVRHYIEVSETTQISVVFYLYYLDETSLRSYLAGNYGSVTAFRYSDYEYMRAKFTIVFEIGVDVLPAPAGGGGE